MPRLSACVHVQVCVCACVGVCCLQCAAKLFSCAPQSGAVFEQSNSQINQRRVAAEAAQALALALPLPLALLAWFMRRSVDVNVVGN